MIRVLIADDHEIVRRGLRMTIAGEEDLELVGEAQNGQQAIDLVDRLDVDVVLLDLHMPEVDGVQAAAAIRAAHPQTAILALTSFGADAQLYAALRAGVNGYLLKDVSGDDLVTAIRGAARGEPQLHPEVARRLMAAMPPPADPLASLSDREREVLRLVGRGLSNKEIGLKLSLSEVTVKGYVSAVLSKLNVVDRTQAALLAVKYGMVRTDDLP